MMASLEVLSTRVESGVAVVTLGSPSRIFFDPEMSDALLEAMTGLAADEAYAQLSSPEVHRDISCGTTQSQHSSPLVKS
jgi:hypothetical protein